MSTQGISATRTVEMERCWSLVLSFMRVFLSLLYKQYMSGYLPSGESSSISGVRSPIARVMITRAALP